MYIQGMSTSLPEDVQYDFYRTIPGLENLKIVRPAYAIEYDCIDPLGLKLNLESRKISMLFCAGQFNGSSGYEEAASQGIMAGINALLAINGKEPFILDRSEAYIGVLIDDLVTKGTMEPYRIMTSRAEYRLVLRQDNADLRLTEKSYRIGLATKERYDNLLRKRQLVEQERIRLENTKVSKDVINPLLEKWGTSPVSGSVSLLELMKRPQVTYDKLSVIDTDRVYMPKHAADHLEVQIKYEGYIRKQMSQIERFKRLEDKRLDQNFAYEEVDGLRLEAVEKLNRFKPNSIGQASRISGVSPADINVLLIHLEKLRRNRNGN